jgi:hypothetical protein
MAILLPSRDSFEKLRELIFAENGLYSAISAIAATVPSAPTRIALRRYRMRIERRRTPAKTLSRSEDGPTPWRNALPITDIVEWSGLLIPGAIGLVENITMARKPNWMAKLGPTRG